MNRLDQAIMRLPWDSDPSLGVRWTMIILTIPFGLGILILLWAMSDMRD